MRFLISSGIKRHAVKTAMIVEKSPRTVTARSFANISRPSKPKNPRVPAHRIMRSPRIATTSNLFGEATQAGQSGRVVYRRKISCCCLDGFDKVIFERAFLCDNIKNFSASGANSTNCYEQMLFCIEICFKHIYISHNNVVGQPSH